jgi:acetoin utilization deacetylase AcuC-like enzyme
MTPAAGEGASAPGGSSSPPGGSPKSRQDLATELEKLAKDLPESARRLKRAKRGPNQTMTGLWDVGLVEVRGYVDRVDQIWADSIDDGEPEASGTQDTAPAAFTQLEKAIDDAVVVINAAIDALERDSESTTTRSDCYRKAADQLTELAKRCDGLVVHLRGTEGLE